MDPLLKPGGVDTRFWPVDKVIIAYFAGTTAIFIGWYSVIPAAPSLLLWHVFAIAVLVFQVKRPNPTTRIFRYWYPLPYVASCYKEMAVDIPPIRGTTADQWLADLDFRFWGVHPTVWLERLYSPALTELLQIVYTLFIPAVLLVALVLWKKRRFREFQYYAFLIALGYLVSYVGYVLVPARGPRFLLRHFEHAPLQGMWFFHDMQNTLDRLESIAYDCFPSGHTELTILAWWYSRVAGNRLFWVYFAYTPTIIFATVYLRYHYTVDVLAGVLVAAALIVATPSIYRRLQERA
ncbi:MAG TPA: phosphatase PAP2 family protein [Bryobacteraceae bacterium]|nr:phosphatase PAP2 family protein [Bryobacteraceae bacterium]